MREVGEKLKDLMMSFVLVEEDLEMIIAIYPKYPS